MFWAIKHGIKMSAMPAWGSSHDDQAIWEMVAFLQKLPELTPEQYNALTQSSGGGEEGHHHHGDASADASDEHGHGDEGHHHSDANTAASDEHHPTDASPTPDAPLSLDGLKAKAMPEAEQVALAFHSALQKGDRNAVLALLAVNVTVSKSGHTQSRDEYASGHLGGDIAFLKTAQVKPISLASMPMGETAMVGSESEIRATIKGWPIVSRSREVLTLKCENGTWRIISMRWQSFPANGQE